MKQEKDGKEKRGKIEEDWEIDNQQIFQIFQQIALQ
jgi:hypothetical protein